MSDAYIIEKYGVKNLSKAKKNLSDGPAESKRRFIAKYPGADVSKFEFSVLLNYSGDINKYIVAYTVSKYGAYDITSDEFMNNKEWVKYLYQLNLDRIEKNSNNGPAESKRRFLIKYPGADVSKFEFSADLTSTGNIDRYTVYYKVDGGSYDITSDTFMNNKEWSWYLYQWSKIWSIYGTVQPYVKNPVTAQYKISDVRVYVDNSQFFDGDVGLPEPIIDDDVSSDDIESNSYLASLYAVYITTYLCGICTKHLLYTSGTPKIITSIARYHLYYHTMRFIRNPSRMTKYITPDVKAAIMNNKLTQYEWSDKAEYSYYGSLDKWISSRPKGTVRNVKWILSPLIGQFTYEERGAWTVKGQLKDYQLFIATESNGLTATGQLLLQMSIESYVYCILGAQAKTRWPIVGRGAMSLQSQEVFYKLVFDTIAQDDQTVAVSNMRRAIKDTNVILNMAISPGIILIPSDMTILTEMVPGYNNILTLAGGDMTFGVNTAVNYLKPIGKETTPAKTDDTSKGENKASTDDTLGDPVADGRYVSRQTPSSYGADIYLAIIALSGGVLVSKYVL